MNIRFDFGLKLLVMAIYQERKGTGGRSIRHSQQKIGIQYFIRYIPDELVICSQDNFNILIVSKQIIPDGYPSNYRGPHLDQFVKPYPNLFQSV